MALTASIFKADIEISDLRRHHYQPYQLTLARHPSETDERMMLRLLSFALFADPALQFTRGLSNDDEPDLWRHSLSGETELWIELGQPSEKRLRRARSKARHVVVVCYGGRRTAQWWQENQGKLSQQSWLSVIEIPEDESRALSALTQRSMQLQFTLDEDSVWVSSSSDSIAINPQWLHGEQRAQ